MVIVLSGVNDCEAFLDDIVVFSSTWSNHLDTLQEVFCCLERASLTLNLVKCEFGKAVVTYLGKQVGQGQLCPLVVKGQAILDFPVPENRRQLRRFLGMCGYYPGFCKTFASVVVPLVDLSSPSRPFCLGCCVSRLIGFCKSSLVQCPCVGRPRFYTSF